jgi:hypothetical protein
MGIHNTHFFSQPYRYGDPYGLDGLLERTAPEIFYGRFVFVTHCQRVYTKKGICSGTSELPLISGAGRVDAWTE